MAWCMRRPSEDAVAKGVGTPRGRTSIDLVAQFLRKSQPQPNPLSSLLVNSTPTNWKSFRRVPRGERGRLPTLERSSCLPKASSPRTAFGFAPFDPADHAEGEQTILCKGQKERLHLHVELCRLLGSHRVKRKSAASVLSRNVVRDRLRNRHRSGHALAQLLEQPLLLQFGDPIERLVGRIVGEMLADLAIALAPGSGLLLNEGNSEHAMRCQDAYEARQNHIPLHPVQALAPCHQRIGTLGLHVLTPSTQPPHLRCIASTHPLTTLHPPKQN